MGSSEAALDDIAWPRIINRFIARPRQLAVMKDFRILLKNVRPYAGLFTIAFLLMALVGLFEAGRTALLKSIIDELPGTSKGPTSGLAAIVDARNYLPQGVEALPIIAFLLIVFTLIRGTSEYLSSVLMWRIGVSTVVDLRQRLYNHILLQSREFFTEHPTNELTTHIISDSEKVQVAVSTLLA